MGILRTCINLGELDVFLALSVDCPFGDHSEALEHTQLCDVGTVTVPIFHSGKQTPQELNGLRPHGTGGFFGVGPPARGLVWGRMWTLETQGWPRFRVPAGGPRPHPLPLQHCGPLSLLSPLGLQDKLNKRDKEVTALMSQTEMLRAQVSGKSPSRRADAGGSCGGLEPGGVDWVGFWVWEPSPTLP